MFHIFLLPFIIYHCHPIHSVPGPLQCNSYIADPGKHSSKQVSDIEISDIEISDIESSDIESCFVTYMFPVPA